jgi:hypothetical protein
MMENLPRRDMGEQETGRRFGWWPRWVVASALVASVAAGMVGTVHWPLVGDAPLMHYVVLLMDHGKVPYRDIVDINMPGTYALEWGAVHLLGPGAAGWRAFDFGLMAACLGAMLVISWPVDWLIGLFAGALFALIHLRDGPANTGQRDLMMTAMLLAACAFLFYAVRRNRAWGAVGFGMFAGAATLIKPSGLLFAVAFAALLVWWLWELKLPWGRYLVGAVVGFAVPVAVTVGWLLAHGALGDFVAANRGLVAYHASLGRRPLAALVVGSFPTLLLVVAVPSLPLLLKSRPWRTWWGRVFLAGVVLGAASYVVQGKGFPYHRYPTEAFLLLLCGWVLVTGMQAQGWMRWAAVAGLVGGALWLAPSSAWIAVHYDWRNQEFNQLLEADLRTLDAEKPGGAGLNGRVQCVDMTSGCLNTLYNMDLVESTGYLYDCYLFQPRQTAVSAAYREGFWKAIEANPPEVMVVTDQECFSLGHSWKLPLRWPQFAELLQTKYRLVEQRTPPDRIAWWRHPVEQNSYRLYVREQP